MAAGAAVRVDHLANPFALALDVWRNAVAGWPGAGEVALRRQMHQREPIERRIVLGGRFRVRGRDSRQVQRFAGCGRHLRRIDQAVAAHPDVVVPFWKIGHQIAALVVRHHDLAERRGQICRLGDHPHAGLRAARTGDHAADVIGVHRHGRLSGDPQARAGERRRDDRRKGDARDRSEELFSGHEDLRYGLPGHRDTGTPGHLDTLNAREDVVNVIIDSCRYRFTFWKYAGRSPFVPFRISTIARRSASESAER